MARYVAKFSKGYGVKFISHLDLMRCIQRSIRRADIPISYSQGFNPHCDLSFATPLPVGTWSLGDYLEVKLENEMDEQTIIDRLNHVLPQHIKMISIKTVNEAFPSLMSLVSAASYEITMVNVDPMLKEGSIAEFIGRPVIEVTKSGKNGQKIIDIKPMIQKIRLKIIDNNIALLSSTVDIGSKSNLNPELIVEGLKLYMDGFSSVQIRDIKKNETYIKKDGLYKTPLELI